MKKPTALWILCILTMLSAGAQPLAVRIQQQTGNLAFLKSIGITKPELVAQCYKLRQYQPMFLTPNEALLQAQLSALLLQAGALGLEQRDYQPAFIQALRENKLAIHYDSISRELLFADAMLHFCQDVFGGNSQPAFSFDGLQYQPGSTKVLEVVQHCLATNDLTQAVPLLEPPQPEYTAAINLYQRWFAALQTLNFFEPVITGTATENRLMQERLHQLGLLDSAATRNTHKIRESVKAAQLLFDLPQSGVPDKSTIQALNVPLVQRLAALRNLLNNLRWLQALKLNEGVAIVNIAAARLLVYQQGAITLDSRIIAGKPTTPTPTLTSRIQEVVVYPYWHVPHTIATRELLPRIKRNIAYLETNQFQILDRKGNIVDPHSVNWRSLAPGNFPYTIRQSTGCDNSLGIVKFNFYNPFSVYLHDTPSKGLFAARRRFYSHGCMRVEKPVELARLLLNRDKATLDALTAQCLRNQMPTELKPAVALPVVVLYSTVWHTAAGRIVFYADIYRKENRQAATARTGD